MEGFTWVDYMAVGIFIVSIIGGLMRGVVKEVLSVLTWIAAFFVATMFSSSLASVFSNSSTMQSVIATSSNNFHIDASHPASLVAIGLSFTVLFIGTMIAGSLISFIMTKTVQSIGMGAINRLLGGAFGVVRGYLIVLVVLFLGSLTSLSVQSSWTQSQFVNSFNPTVQWLGEIVQPGLESLKVQMGNAIRGAGSQFQQGIMNIYQNNNGNH